MADDAREWWLELYDDDVADILLEPAPSRVLDLEVAFLVGVLGIDRGTVVFDQCCGLGRIGLPLAARGAIVHGCDVVPGYVERARTAAHRAGMDIALTCADAFEFVTPIPCDAAFNWWTSFGYADDERNTRMLRRAFESLRPGGRFALDFMNLGQILRRFESTMIDRRPTSRGSVTLIRKSVIDLESMVLEKCWIFEGPDGERRIRPSVVRLYSPLELHELLRSVGFTDIVTYGDLDRTPIGLDSPRCIVVAKRPET